MWRYDIVLDASDNVATRYLLNDACILSQKPLVSGSALRFEGQVYERCQCPLNRWESRFKDVANGLRFYWEGDLLNHGNWYRKKTWSLSSPIPPEFVFVMELSSPISPEFVFVMESSDISRIRICNGVLRSLQNLHL